MTGGAVSTRQLTALRISFRSAAGSLRLGLLERGLDAVAEDIVILEKGAAELPAQLLAASTRRPSRSQVLGSSSFFFFFSGSPSSVASLFVVTFSLRCPSRQALLQRLGDLSEFSEELVAELLIERGAKVFVAGREAQRLDGLEVSWLCRRSGRSTVTFQ